MKKVESVPTMTPIAMISEKLNNVLPPRATRQISTSSVVPDVSSVRLSVAFREWLTTSLNVKCFIVLSSSRIRS